MLRDTMKIAAFVDIRRTILPCTGVGRHANGVLRALDARRDSDITLLLGKDQINEHGSLPDDAPLRTLGTRISLRSARRAEQFAKLTGLPTLDHRLPEDVDWVYCPHDTLIASKKLPVAITFHDARIFEPELFPKRFRDAARTIFMRSWMKRAASTADIVFTVSEFSKARLTELLGLDADKIVAVGNGIGSHISKQIAQPIRLRKDRVLVVGGLRHLKGGDLVVQVAQRLSEMGSPTEIISIGGPDDPELAAEADRLPNLRSVGYLSDERIAEAMREASALFFPSRYEGFGMPPIEAMALGTPVVATSSTSLPEILADGALFIESGDVDGAIFALNALQSDTHRRDLLVARGRTVASRYSWDAVAERVRLALAKAS